MTARLYRLAARCPVCRAAPAQRVSQRSVEEKRSWDPDEVVETVQCQQCMRERRIVRYAITAGDYQKAS